MYQQNQQHRQLLLDAASYFNAVAGFGIPNGQSVGIFIAGKVHPIEREKDTYLHPIRCVGS